MANDFGPVWPSVQKAYERMIADVAKNMAEDALMTGGPSVTSVHPNQGSGKGHSRQV